MKMLISDENGFWYVIPQEKAEEWQAFLNAHYEYVHKEYAKLKALHPEAIGFNIEGTPPIPEWAVSVEHPSDIRFETYENK